MIKHIKKNFEFMWFSQQNLNFMDKDGFFFLKSSRRYFVLLGYISTLETKEMETLCPLYLKIKKKSLCQLVWIKKTTTMSN
jgi:hypothetical protein